MAEGYKVSFGDGNVLKPAVVMFTGVCERAEKH